MRIHGKMKFKRTLLLPHTFPSEMDLKKETLKIMLYLIETKPINYIVLTWKHVQKHNTQVANLQNNEDSWKNEV